MVLITSAGTVWDNSTSARTGKAPVHDYYIEDIAHSYRKHLQRHRLHAKKAVYTYHSCHAVIVKNDEIQVPRFLYRKVDKMTMMTWRRRAPLS
jgi:hypothetical protein